MKVAFLFLFRDAFISNTLMMGAKHDSGVSVKGLYCFAFEQNESTPVLLETAIDCLIYILYLMHSYISDRTLKNKLIKLCTACCIFIPLEGCSKR